MSEERLKIAIKDALSENSQLQESQKQVGTIWGFFSL